jgi:hypothetical protein
MKVKIGPYLRWWGPYQIADLLQFVGVSEEKCYAFGEKLSKTKLNDICEWIHEKRKRKIKVNIEPYDVWSMDHTLAHIVFPMLIELRANKCGAPGGMKGFAYSSRNQWSQTCFAFYEEGDADADQAGFDEWDEIMDKMIWAFDFIVQDKEYDDIENIEANRARVTEGLELFGKHYQSLWD